MTLQKRKELKSKSQSYLNMLNKHYTKMFNDTASEYLIETNWKKSSKLMHKMDVLKNDLAAIYEALEQFA